MKRRTVLVGAGTMSAVVGGSFFYWPRRWDQIIIHHSAGNHATVETLRQVRRDRQPNTLINAIPYHYVIGNGNGIPLGEVVETTRVKYDLWGAHVANRRRNLVALGICLVGNFEHVEVPSKQFDAAVALTRSLMQRYAIPPQRVTPHGETPGEATKCPGAKFPFNSFLRAIS